MRFLIVSQGDNGKLCDTALQDSASIYQRISPEKLTPEIIKRVMPDVLVADISIHEVCSHDIVLSGIPGHDYATIFVEINEDTTETSLRKSILREVRQAYPAFSNEPSAGSTANETAKQSTEKLKIPVWIVGASSGGPKAIFDLLESSNAGESAIILSLHINEAGFNDYIGLLKDTIRNTNWILKVSGEGLEVTPGTIIAVHPSQSIRISPQGIISLEEPDINSKFKPCINEIIKHSSQAIENLGVAILSGIGSDGAASCSKYKSQIKSILAQNDAAIPYMPSACAEAGGLLVSISEITENIQRAPGA